MEPIMKAFMNIPTTCISDCMNGLNNMDPAIKPLEERYKMAGRALTVKIPVGDNLVLLKAIRGLKTGDVLVIDTKGDEYRAIAGDFIIGMAETLGATAFVVDGVIRDIVDIKKLNFPVFARGAAVASSAKVGAGEFNVPISCGKTSVNPGDIVVGDANGVVVIPQAIEQEILDKALAKMKKDEKRENEVSGNIEEIKKYIDQMLTK